jgi:hypothetical protein
VSLDDATPIQTSTIKEEAMKISAQDGKHSRHQLDLIGPLLNALK